MQQRQVSFEEAVKRALANYCCFTGRASRSEFWWFSLFTTILSCVITLVFAILTALFHSTAPSTIGTFVNYAVSLALFLPSFGLTFRRLHDTGRSGWWWLISLIPVAGLIILLVFLCSKSNPEANQYGEMPNMI